MEAAEVLREAIGIPIYPVYRDSYKGAVVQAHAALGEPALRAARAEGRLMTPHPALAAAFTTYHKQHAFGRLTYDWQASKDTRHARKLGLVG